MPEIQDDQNEPSEKPSNSGKAGKEGGPRGTPGGAGGDGNMRFSRSMLGWILILSIAVLIFVVFHQKEGSTSEVAYSVFHQHLEQGHVKLIVVRDSDTIEATLKDNVANEKTGDTAHKLIAHVPQTAM